jgi:hypothetical protein
VRGAACCRRARPRAGLPLTRLAPLPPPPSPTRSYNLSIGVGLSQVNGKVFRIGHLGNMDELMMCSALSGAEMAMIDAGMKIKPGSGVGRGGWPFWGWVGSKGLRWGREGVEESGGGRRPGEASKLEVSQGGG